MHKEKIFILLPDGIGLRNFAYTEFYESGKKLGYDVVFWNNTPFDLTELGFSELRMPTPKLKPVTDILKTVKTAVELNENIRKSHDTVYDSYRFKLSTKNLKSFIKNSLASWLIFRHNSTAGLKKIDAKLTQGERGTAYYKACREVLEREKPAFVFCTNQRMTHAIAPVSAAQDLGIPTATFIFSWDNLPKGTKAITTDFYFVWSEHMKGELLFYYPYIQSDQVYVTGTPQFEPHFNPGLRQSKSEFYTEYGLDADKKYLCFSGDDITTSPYDQHYLSDTAKAVRKLNEKGFNLGLIFRRSPADFSNRYDEIIKENRDIITAIDPKWTKLGKEWNTILPTKADMILLTNTIAHTELVINLGSSMVFDYCALDKPCGFINYDIPNGTVPGWSVRKIYNFIHFRSMPDKKAVFWLNDPEKIDEAIEKMLTDKTETVANAKKWFEKITMHPPRNASARIWESIVTILNNK